MAKLTDSQDRALRLFKNGGVEYDAELLSRNRISINGKVVPASPMTFLYLVGLGLINFVSPRKLGLTDAGRKYLDILDPEKLKKKIERR